jgi:antitoxin component YwqK of YwqJK toxin-antitoxin module
LNSESGVKVNLASGYAMERVDIEDLYFEDYCHAYQGKPFTGIGEEVSGSGAMISEIEFKDGMQHGTTRGWHPNGRLRRESMYRHNALHGQHREYYDDGRLKKDEEYENGVCLRSQEWDKDGNLKEEYHIRPGSVEYEILQLSRRPISEPENK